MNGIEEYIAASLKGTYLSRREKRAWAEEMQAHLADSVDERIRAGERPDEAKQAAIKAFGTASGVRRQIIRETYGVSPLWFVIASAVGVAGLLLAWWVGVRTGDMNPATMASIPTPAWVTAVGRHFVSSQDAWIALTVLLVTFVFTRKRADRAVLLAVAAILASAWSIDRMSHHMGAVGQVFFAQGTSLWIPPFGPQQLAGYVLLLVLSLAAYAWTRNRVVSLTLWIATMAFTIWAYMVSVVQETLYLATGNPVFWGHLYPDMYTVIWGIITVAARVIVLFAVLYGCRRIDRMVQTQRATTA